MSRDDAPARDLATDRPGRMDAYGGGPRSAFEATDFHDLEEEAFVRKVAAILGGLADEGRVGSLVLTAAPRALGAMRPHYPPALRRVLRAEIDVDLTPMPVADIEKRFARG